MKRLMMIAIAVATLPFVSGCCCWRPPATFAAAPVVAPPAPACDPCQTAPAPVSYGYSGAYAAPAYGTTPYATP